MSDIVTNNNNLVSIIIPVYNVEEYLEKCLDSIEKQSHKNLEIILIDDGSKDKSGKICDKYAKKDKRVKVIHQENVGLSGARNAGINIATGKYITFVDSDDIVSEKFVEYLYELAEEKKADIVICSSYKFFDEKEIVSDINVYPTVVEYNSKTALEDMLYRRNITAYACSKLYITELFRNINFPEGQLFEDLNTTYKLLDLAETIIWSPLELYFYRQRMNSIVNSGFDKRKLSVIDAGIEIKKFIEKKYPDITEAAISKIYISAVDQYRKVPNEKEFLKERNSLKFIIKNYRKTVLKDRKNKLMVRIIAFMSCISINGVRNICKCYTILNEKFHLQLKKPV